MTRTEFLNCYEQEELYERWELELAEWLDNEEDDSDDEFIKQTFYPDEF